MNQWKRAIETWFTGKEEQMVRQIADLVAVPSVGGESAGPCQPFGEGPAKALEVALLQAQAAGLRAENQGGYVLTADLNDCPDELHILAHLDVVAPGEGWDTDPYTLVQEGDLIYGRGVDDDKGPAVAAMMAMECVKALNVPLKRNVKLVLGTDEETGSRSGRKVYAREAQDAALALVFEGGRERDGRPRFVTSRRGVILGTVDVAGREAHAGKAYLEGRSAVLELAHQIIRLYSFNDYEKGIYYNVAPISGGRPNGVVAGEARGEFCVAGIPENADFPVIQARLDSMADQVTVEGCRVQVTYRTLFPAMERNAANHSAYLRAAEAAELLGWEPEEIADPAATDGAYLSTYGVPTVDALSAIAEQIHTTEERVRIPSIRDRTALCAAMLGLLG